MLSKYYITKVFARQILDSRCNPTVEATVCLNCGVCASASVPSGASTGRNEAKELRDKDHSHFLGAGVLKAVNNVNRKIAPAIISQDARNQHKIDEIMLKLDGTEDKSNLGANAILAVSLAVARAAATALKLPLFRYLGGVNANILPIPMMNILNGGVHADNNLEIQEFMIMPKGFENFSDALRCGCEVYHALRKVLKLRNLSVSVGDEGGFAPNLDSDKKALELILEAIETAGYKAGKDIVLALDAAASGWFDSDRQSYYFNKSKKEISKDDLINYWVNLTREYPIFSIEDPFYEEDFSLTSKLTQKIGDTVQIVGDDLFVTNKNRLLHGINQKSGNAILIKPNQIGTLSEVMDTVQTAKISGYKTIISHRSGETEDTFIADLAVSLNAGQIKTGAPCRVDRTCKYNRLIRIEGYLSNAGNFAKL